MKFTLLLSAFTFLVLTSSFSQSIQFEKLPHTPPGFPGNSELIADNNGTWYVYAAFSEGFSTAGFFYRSQDGGANWQRMDAEYNMLLVAPEGFLYRILYHHIYKSLDEGENWELANGEEWLNLAITKEGTLLALGLGGLKRSTDQGTSFQTISVTNGMGAITLDNFQPAKDGSIYAFDYLSTPQNDSIFIFRSTDDGLSWQLKSFFVLNVGNVKSLFSTSSGRIFLSLTLPASPSLYFSDNQGATWTAASSDDAYYNSLVELPSGELWMNGGHGPSRSLNNGTNWQLIDAIGVNTYCDLTRKLWQLQNGDIIGDIGSFLFKALDGSYENWQPISNGSEQPVIRDIEVVDDDHIWVTTSSGLFRTNNGGNDWEHVYQRPLPFFGSSHNYYQDLCLDAMGNPILIDRLHVWRIAANTGIVTDLTPLAFNINDDIMTGIVSLLNGDIILGTSHKTFISHDGANTWVQINANGPFTTITNADYLNADTYLLRNNADEVFSYNPLTNVASPYPIPSSSTGIISDLTVVQPGIIHIASIDPSYCVSMDAGQNWACHDFLPGNEYFTNLVANNHGGVFGDTNFGYGLRYSADNGATWINLNDSSTVIPAPDHITTMKVSPSQRLYIGGVGENHLVRSVLETSASHEATQLAPLAIYPNPSSGLLQLDIPNNGFANGPITLSVMDMYGNMRHTKVLEYAHSIQCNMNGLPSGVYFASLKDAHGQVIGIGKWIIDN